MPLRCEGVPVGIGLDIVDLQRFSVLYGEDDPELLARCFTATELLAVGDGLDRLPRLAARFAAKEATYKALGGVTGAALTDIVVETGKSGAPTLLISGAVQRAAEAKGVRSFLVSLTHSDASAAAVVIALAGGPR
jgi:holo-[acyl-carrier protein] synthase